MGITEIIKVGQWLNFKAGTCFGETKDHLGVFVAISDELGICIAINATSNVKGVKDYATHRHIDSAKTIVVIEPGSSEASYHFHTETAFDCNRPAFVKHDELTKWIASRRIELASYNVAVDKELLIGIRQGIMNSPLVPEKYKKLILGSST